MVEKIKHYSLTSPASIYDEEALTALELAGRTAGKVNELVDEVNRFTEDTEKKQKDAIDAIPSQISKEVNKHIADGAFEEAISEHLDDLNERVDNLLGSVGEGSTSLDAEVIDMRVGVFGETFENAGTAVREGVRSMKTLITNSMRDLKWARGSFDAQGNNIESTNSNYYSEIIPVERYHAIDLRTLSDNVLVNMVMYQRGKFVARYTWNRYSICIPAQPYGYDIRLMVCANESEVGADVANSFGLKQLLDEVDIRIYGTPLTLEDLDKKIDRFGASYPLTPWTDGNIDDAGIMRNGETEIINMMSAPIPAKLVKSIKLTSRGEARCNYVLLTGKGVQTPYARGEWTKNGVLKYDMPIDHVDEHDGFLYILLSRLEGSSITRESVIKNVDVEIEWRVPNVGELSARVDELTEKVAEIEKPSDSGGNSEYLAKIAACQFDGNIVTFSVDDVIDICKSVHQMLREYNDPYPPCNYSDELGYLNELTSSGIPVTLNLCLESEDGSFKLSDIPDHYNDTSMSTFGGYFMVESGNFKIAFHGRKPSTVYTDADTLVNDYAEFMAFCQRENLVGQIDKFVRVSYFSGAREALRRLHDEYGVIGFYTRDDGSTGENYDLADDEGKWLGKRGVMYDDDNELVFVKSLPRMDSKSVTSIVTTVKDKKWKHNAVFLHETIGWSSIAEKFDGVAGTLEADGYRLGFLSDVYGGL